MGADDALAAGAGNAGVVAVEHVAVGPVFVQVAPRAEPIVEHLAADDMTAGAPHVAVVARRMEVIVADQQIVDVGHLEGEVVETGTLPFDAEQSVVIDIACALVDPVERGGRLARPTATMSSPRFPKR